jgi:quercetin 2,3-dioxygenase
MSSSTRPRRFVKAVAQAEGAGVTVQRTIGTPALRNYDPFMLLDHFSSDDPDDYIAGFPSHPHRGFSTFTYMLDGVMEHKDSMGNSGLIGPGAAQWMKAASGVTHSEMPKQKNGLMRGFQLWVNLPAANKMDRPEYQEFAADDFPVVETADYKSKVLMGYFMGVQAPIVDDIGEVSYIDVQLQAGKTFQQPLVAGHNRFVFVFEGSASLDGEALALHTLVTLADDEKALTLRANELGARFIVVSGKPVNEAIVQYGPFVMNSREEIDAALRDFNDNSFVRDRAWIKPLKS